LLRTRAVPAGLVVRSHSYPALPCRAFTYRGCAARLGWFCAGAITETSSCRHREPFEFKRASLSQCCKELAWEPVPFLWSVSLPLFRPFSAWNGLDFSFSQPAKPHTLVKRASLITKEKVQPAEGLHWWIGKREIWPDPLYLVRDYAGPHWPFVLLAPLAAEATGMKMGCEVKPP